MGFGMLLKAGVKRQFGTIVGVFALVAAASTALVVASALGFGAREHVSAQMDRLGFGDVTAWVSGVDDAEALALAVAEAPGVGEARAQPLIFAGYAVNGFHSDDEGQVVAYDGQAYPYAFLSEGFEGAAEARDVQPGSVYASPALHEGFGVQVGDVVSFELTRTGESYDLVVAGWFEDPFMGSSMIDMKSFLVSPQDYESMAALASGASSFDELAREGAMIHVSQQNPGELAPLEFDRLLGQDAQLSQYLEFSYSRDAVEELMVLQQTVLAGFLALFALALAAVALIVLSHAVSSSIELERRDIASLKTVGYASSTLRRVQTAQYALGALAGMAVGSVIGSFASGSLSTALVTSAGMLVPAEPQLALCLTAYAAALAVLAATVTLKTRSIVSVRPVEAPAAGTEAGGRAARTPIVLQAPGASLALRGIASGKARYAAMFAIAALLVLFASAVGRVNAWVGPHGEGLMDAFSAADHDLGVQPLGPTDMEGVERVVNAHDEIVGVYSLAMQPVRVEGAAYTANVIDAPERFHILEGRTCEGPDEIVLTRTVAADLGLRLGDEVEVAAEGSPQRFRVAGIYQCANEMGANVGMSLDGYARVGDVRGYIWCYHYLLADGSRNDAIAAELQESYGASAAVHTNGWSGLSGLVGIMRALLALLYGATALLVLASTALAASKLLRAERMDLAVLKSIGFASGELRRAFALRMGLVAFAGALAGLVLSALFADEAIGSLVRFFGIGAFSSSLGFADSIAPAAGIVALTAALAYLFSQPVKRAEPVELFADFDG